MAISHFDVIILGESLAARVAATLLTRAGRRVLMAGTPIDPLPEWIPCTLPLLRLLEQLGEDSCLVSSPPFQVLSGGNRLTFHGRSPLDEEFRREFPMDHPRALEFLGRLNQTGEAIQTIAWDCGGLPLRGFANRRRFLWKSLFKGFTRRKLSRPLTREMGIGFAPQTAKALETLFSGLALRPIEHVSLGQASIIWNGVVSGRGIFSADLNDLLGRLFDRSGGERVPLTDLKKVQGEGGRLREAVFANDHHCTADIFILGNRKAAAHLPSSHQPGETTSQRVASFDIRIISGEVSPLLARSVLIEGPPPTHLSQIADSPAKRYRADFHAVGLDNENPPPSFKEGFLKHFPFAELDITPGSAGRPHHFGPQNEAPRSESTAAFFGEAGSLIAGENLVYSCGEYVLPTLGPTGEILVGVTTFNHLQIIARSSPR